MQLPTALVIAVVAQTPDLDGSGCVDLADFASVQVAMGGPTCAATSFMEMVLVPGGGSGPDYDFLCGQYEVTVEQFVAFLNDAQQDGGATDRGDNLRFSALGAVESESGDAVYFDPGVYGAFTQYNPVAPAGARYRPLPGAQRSAARRMTWHLAAKFCNWLTLRDGLPSEERCYIESPNFAGWRPATAAAGWSTAPSDLSREQRAKLVADYHGYRLPMDGWGRGLVPSPESDPNEFNEWLKAAAYDPNGPPTRTISARPLPEKYWSYGFGRDQATLADCCGVLAFSRSVGYFDGHNWTGLAALAVTADTSNTYGLYDATGGVAEWLQELCGTGSMAVRGGSYATPWPITNVFVRGCSPNHSKSEAMGFRVVRIPG